MRRKSAFPTLIWVKLSADFPQVWHLSQGLTLSWTLSSSSSLHSQLSLSSLSRPFIVMDLLNFIINIILISFVSCSHQLFSFSFFHFPKVDMQCYFVQTMQNYQFLYLMLVATENYMQLKLCSERKVFKWKWAEHQNKFNWNLSFNNWSSQVRTLRTKLSCRGQILAILTRGGLGQN